MMDQLLNMFSDAAGVATIVIASTVGLSCMRLLIDFCKAPKNFDTSSEDPRPKTQQSPQQASQDVYPEDSSTYRISPKTDVELLLGEVSVLRSRVQSIEKQLNTQQRHQNDLWWRFRVMSVMAGIALFFALMSWGQLKGYWSNG